MKEKIGVESMVGELFNIIILICIMIKKAAASCRA